jgi:hypothetical protein
VGDPPGSRTFEILIMPLRVRNVVAHGSLGSLCVPVE